MTPQFWPDGSVRQSVNSGTCRTAGAGKPLALKGDVHASSVMEAERLFQSRQYGSAASICAEALELEPDNLDLRILRARALMALRRDEEAKREMSRALRWHPAS